MRTSILTSGFLAALLLATASEATAQSFRHHLPSRPPTPAVRPGLVTPSMGARALPSFANVTTSPQTGITPPYNPGFSSFNYGFNNFNPYNALNTGYGYGFPPFANPYAYGMNPYLSPYNTGYFPGVNPLTTPFNPYFGTGMYNPYFGY